MSITSTFAEKNTVPLPLCCLFKMRLSILASQSLFCSLLEQHLPGRSCPNLGSCVAGHSANNSFLCLQRSVSTFEAGLRPVSETN